MSHKMSGARFLAETLHGYGVTHVFFVEAILRRTLMELESLGVRRVLTHSEKAAAYMADGYARAGRKPGVCMAQAVGAANLASGLQEPLLGRSPVIALTDARPSRPSTATPTRKFPTPPSSPPSPSPAWR
jgi:acetolactate synthase-1/2/3 large subunit